MRFIPGSRHYLCEFCGYTSLSFFKKASILLRPLPYRKINAIIKARRDYSEKTKLPEKAV
jgi:hypothetical protein